MARILVTPEEVDDVSTRFKTASEESRELASQLNSSIEGLSGNWEGMTKNRFYTQFQTAKTTMEQYATMLQEISAELTIISQRFRTADQQG